MKFELFLYRLEGKIRKIAIEKLMQIISVVMLMVYIFEMVVFIATDGEFSLIYWLDFSRALIFKGQVWRIISFIFVPPESSNPIFTLLAIYFFYWTGSAVESHFGKERFNIYYFFGVFCSIIAGLICGGMSNLYLNLSIFLAFATMFPNVTVMVFFILPVKVKWIGMLEGVLYIWMLVQGVLVGIFYKDWSIVAAIAVAILNYFIFFGRTLVLRIKDAYREYKWRRGNRY